VNWGWHFYSQISFRNFFVAKIFSIFLTAITLVACVSGWAQNIENGREVFNKCASCHSTNSQNGTAPGLGNIIERQAGTLRGFRYSRAMKASKIYWDEKSLNEYLQDPQKFVSGNVMPFSGLRTKTERDDVVAYLKTLRE